MAVGSDAEQKLARFIRRDSMERNREDLDLDSKQANTMLIITKIVGDRGHGEWKSSEALVKIVFVNVRSKRKYARTIGNVCQTELAPTGEVIAKEFEA